MPTHISRVRRYVRARRKAVAGGLGAFAVFAVTALLLDPGTRDTLTAWAPEWSRPVLGLIVVVATAWAVERTRNRPTEE